jgi:hypothetical protein
MYAPASSALLARGICTLHIWGGGGCYMDVDHVYTALLRDRTWRGGGELYAWDRGFRCYLAGHRLKPGQATAVRRGLPGLKKTDPRRLVKAAACGICTAHERRRGLPDLPLILYAPYLHVV